MQSQHDTMRDLQDNRLLHEYWYVFVQQRFEIEQQMTEVPGGYSVVFQTPGHTNEKDMYTYTILYMDKISQFYTITKSAHEWKHLWADWLFHRGNLPSLDFSNNIEYETLFQTTHEIISEADNTMCENWNTILSAGVYKTLEVLKRGIRNVTNAKNLHENEQIRGIHELHKSSQEEPGHHLGVLQVHKRKCMQDVKAIVHSVNWEHTSAVLTLKTQEVASTNLKIDKDNCTEELLHLLRVASYKLGQLIAVALASGIFGSSADGFEEMYTRILESAKNDMMRFFHNRETTHHNHDITDHDGTSMEENEREITQCTAEIAHLDGQAQQKHAQQKNALDILQLKYQQSIASLNALQELQNQSNPTSGGGAPNDQDPVVPNGDSLSGGDVYHSGGEQTAGGHGGASQGDSQTHHQQNESGGQHVGGHGGVSQAPGGEQHAGGHGGVSQTHHQQNDVQHEDGYGGSSQAHDEAGDGQHVGGHGGVSQTHHQQNDVQHEDGYGGSSQAHDEAGDGQHAGGHGGVSQTHDEAGDGQHAGGHGGASHGPEATASPQLPYPAETAEMQAARLHFEAAEQALLSAHAEQFESERAHHEENSILLQRQSALIAMQRMLAVSAAGALSQAYSRFGNARLPASALLRETISSVSQFGMSYMAASVAECVRPAVSAQHMGAITQTHSTVSSHGGIGIRSPIVVSRNTPLPPSMHAASSPSVSFHGSHASGSSHHSWVSQPQAAISNGDGHDPHHVQAMADTFRAYIAKVDTNTVCDWIALSGRVDTVIAGFIDIAFEVFTGIWEGQSTQIKFDVLASLHLAFGLNYPTSLAFNHRDSIRAVNARLKSDVTFLVERRGCVDMSTAREYANNLNDTTDCPAYDHDESVGILKDLLSR